MVLSGHVYSIILYRYQDRIQNGSERLSVMITIKGALCSFGEKMLMSRERPPLADFLLPKQTK